MGQSGSGAAAAAHEGVDRAGLGEEQYQALRRALRVAKDGPSARVEMPTFLALFAAHLRPLLQPVFFQLASEPVGGEPSAAWPALVSGLSSFANGGCSWRQLLEAWAPVPDGASGAGEAVDVDLHVELAASLCFWCACPSLAPGSEADDALAAFVAAVQAAAAPPDGEAGTVASAAERLAGAAPCLPRAVSRCLAVRLLGSAELPGVLPLESRILDAGGALLARSLEPRLWESGDWAPLYRDWTDGRSFNGLLKGALHYEGPALLLIKTTKGEVFGALSTAWSDGNGRFAGSPECFLFSLAPKPAVFRGGSRSGNYVYLNARNKFEPQGLGFGGQPKFFRLWIDSNFEECYALETDATYASGALLPVVGLQTNFSIAYIEVWSCGGDEALEAQNKQRERVQNQRDNARKVDKARLVDNEFDKEMFLGKTFKGTAESREVVEMPGKSHERD